MPVMKEYAFIILFACDYVNSRYRAKGRELQGAALRFLWEPGAHCREGRAFWSEREPAVTPVQRTRFVQMG